MATLDFFESFSGYDSIEDMETLDGTTTNVGGPGLIESDPAFARFPGTKYFRLPAGTPGNLPAKTLKFILPASPTREYVLGFAGRLTVSGNYSSVASVSPGTQSVATLGVVFGDSAASMGSSFTSSANSANLTIFLSKNASDGVERLTTSQGNSGTGIMISNVIPTGTIENNVWNYYEIYFKIASASQGAIRLYKNGNLVFTRTGMTFNQSFVTSGLISMFPGSFRSTGGNCLMTDFYIARADGDTWTQFSNKRIARLKPNGPGSNTELIPSDGVGPNWQIADKERMSDNSSFNYTNINDKKDSYSLSEIDFITEEIHAVKIQSSVENPGSGSIYYESTLTDVDGSQNSTKVEVPHAVGIKQQIFERDSQGNVWATEKIDDLQAGIRVSTTIGG